MCSNRVNGSSCSGLGPKGGSQTSAACARGFRLFAVAAMAALLADCTQHPVVADKSAFTASNRLMPLEPKRIASSIIHLRVAVVAKKRARTNKDRADTRDVSHGVASFYSKGTQTANGENFDPNELTAAHRTLPFGTRLRVTNITTGQSVTVRINDRGPFIPGRHVDLSQGAAATLGIVERGVAKVKLDVVE